MKECMGFELSNQKISAVDREDKRAELFSVFMPICDNAKDKIIYGLIFLNRSFFLMQRLSRTGISFK